MADHNVWERLDAETRVERALAGNPQCRGVPMIARRAFSIERGPSGGPELLAYVVVDDLATGCIYGHIRRHPEGGFGSILVHSERFVSADLPLLLMRRFDYWISRRMEHSFVLIREDEPDDGTYAERPTQDAALCALIAMIDRYTTAARWPEHMDARNELYQDLRALGFLAPFGEEMLRNLDDIAPPSAGLRLAYERPTET